MSTTKRAKNYDGDLKSFVLTTDELLKVPDALPLPLIYLLEKNIEGLGLLENIKDVCLKWETASRVPSIRLNAIIA